MPKAPVASPKVASPKVASPVASPAASPVASPVASPAASPAASLATPLAASPAVSNEINNTLGGWINNIGHVLHFPTTILSVAALLVIGTFAESAPRKSLEFLDNYIGKSLFFILPILIAIFIDWPTSLLAAVVSLILFARLQIHDDTIVVAEGFAVNKETDIVSNSKRWFVEQVLGEIPIAISSKTIHRSTTKDEDARTSSSSSMATSGSSDGSSHK